MLLSLAPFMYRDVFSQLGGPIVRVQSGDFPVFDQPSYQACAYLQPGLVQGKSKREIYGEADGTGSASSPMIAQHMAISEALERWAFFDTVQSANRELYGFHEDRSTTGMAAFPGFAWQARRRAHFEALERFALVGWWDKRLSATVHRAPYPGVGLVRIHHGQDKGEVVILYHKAAAGFVSYGHAAGSNLASATSRAAIELARCEYVIARHRALGGLATVSDCFERRCLHFSTPEGHAEFLERIQNRPEKPAPTWRTVYDGEIKGPWSQWTKVWRQCVAMPTYDFLDRKLNFFFW